MVSFQWRGIGTYWGEVRSIGETVKKSGQTSGIIPFVRVMDSLTLAISQGSLRRGSAACYLDVHHPEIRGIFRDPNPLEILIGKVSIYIMVLILQMNSWNVLKTIKSFL